MSAGGQVTYNRRVSEARELVVLLDDAEGTACLFRGTVLLQSRRGALDPRLFEIGETFMRERAERGAPLGLLAVIEPGAPLPSPELRRGQREQVDRWARYERARIAAAILGEDVTADLARSAGRLVGVASPRVQRFAEVTPAVSWLTQELSALAETRAFRATELLDAIGRVRARRVP